MSARLVNRGLDALTWLVLLLMLSPILWLVVSSLQTDGQLSTGAYDLLHPTFTAFSRMWQTVDFERYLINSLIICTVGGAGRDGVRLVCRLRARALQVPRLDRALAGRRRARS